jgi:hypothetical protein
LSILKVLKLGQINETDSYRATVQRQLLNDSSVNIDIQLLPPVITKEHPLSTVRSDYVDDGDDNKVVDYGLSPVLALSIVVFCLLIIQTITKEKKDKLVGRMRIMGM